MANVRVKKLITKLLEVEDLHTHQIYDGMKAMKTGRGHKYRNLPTRNQLTNILAQAPEFIIIKTVFKGVTTDNDSALTLWGIRSD